MKPLDLTAVESGLRTYQRLKPRSKWTGLGLNNKLGHIRAWEQRGLGLELPKGDTDCTSLRYFNWDPPCTSTSDLNVVRGKVLCTVQSERVDNSVRFHTQVWGGGLVGEAIHRCIVEGQDPYCMYKGLELIAKAIGTLMGGVGG